MTCSIEASDRSPIYEDETCGPCEETTDWPLELGHTETSDQSPVSGYETGALGVETTDHTEASDQAPVSENNDSDSCMDEFDAIPPALLVSQSTRDSESSELPPRTTRGKPKVQYSPDIHANVCVPTKLHDALSNPKWMDAMNVEMDALNKNKTWDLVPLPQGKKVVGCRWVFTLKHKADGSIDRYKARLVAKGYTQTYGVDYLEIFAPVAKLNTMHVLLSLAANHDWPLLQFDVKNAFLHGDLNEEIDMDLPPGIPVTSKKGVVCKLRKSLYGLKQSPRAWFGRFVAPMKKFGNAQSNSDHTLFLKRHKETGMLYCKPIDTPSEQNHKLRLYPHQVPTDKERYQRLVGKLIYLSHTRPDIAYAVSESNSWKGVNVLQVWSYNVEGYTDADWADLVTNRHSASGYFTFVGGNLVTWRSKKQKVVSRSSAEAEYRGMAQGVCELLWLRRLLRDLGFGPQKPMDLYCDNKAAITIAHNPVQHDRTKHVEVDRHFVKEKLDAEMISFPFISSEYQLANVLTKVVSTTVFLNSLEKCNIFAPT
ncbi:unnamed protein product [Prunus armeniaca]